MSDASTAPAPTIARPSVRLRPSPCRWSPNFPIADHDAAPPESRGDQLRRQASGGDSRRQAHQRRTAPNTPWRIFCSSPHGRQRLIEQAGAEDEV